MNLWLLLAVFVAPIAAFSLYGLFDWWLPRHRLNRIFKACRRDRCAANVTRLPTPPVLVSGVAVFDQAGAA